MPHPDNKPPMNDAPISVAVPVHNQSAQIDKALSAWANYLAKLERPFEILVVDDASSDDTAKRVEQFATKHPQVILLRQEQQHGVGAALRVALAQAKHPLFFYTSLDYPYQPADLQKLLERINDVDVVNGLRSALPFPPNVALLRSIYNFAARVLIGVRRESAPGWLGTPLTFYTRLMRTLFGVHLLDPDSSFKLFRREIFARIPIQSNGPFVHTEILAKANFLTCWMDEIAIGAQSNSTPDTLRPKFSWKEHWRDLRHVFFRPEFGEPGPPAPANEVAPVSSQS